MFSQVLIENFKCFTQLRLALAPLTLLSGVNAAGKSTVLQAITLLRQTLVQNEQSRSLRLNGEDLRLGTVGEVTEQIFKIGLSRTDGELVLSFGGREARKELSAPIIASQWRETSNGALQEALEASQLSGLLPASAQNSATARSFIETLKRVVYLSADRIGPRETYALSASDQYRGVGAQGEHTIGFLQQFADKPVLAPLRVADTPQPSLIRQVEARLGLFFPGTQFVVTPVPSTNLVTLGLRTSLSTDFHRPQNVGYGLSHVLPIITACLGAEPGQLLLIENPESHLHPAGQSAMGVFLVQVAAAGVQVIVETHSDHILNGLRRAVHGKLLSPEATQLHFFNRAEQDGRVNSQVVSPRLDKNGRIDEWPDGFFDEWDKSLEALLGPSGE